MQTTYRFYNGTRSNIANNLRNNAWQLNWNTTLFGGQVRQDIDAGISDNEDFVDSRRLMKAYSLALHAISSKFLYMAINP